MAIKSRNPQGNRSFLLVSPCIHSRIEPCSRGQPLLLQPTVSWPPRDDHSEQQSTRESFRSTQFTRHSLKSRTLLFWSTFAPADNNVLTTSRWPFWAAAYKRVDPFYSVHHRITQDLLPGSHDRSWLLQPIMSGPPRDDHCEQQSIRESFHSIRFAKDSFKTRTLLSLPIVALAAINFLITPRRPFRAALYNRLHPF